MAILEQTPLQIVAPEAEAASEALRRTRRNRRIIVGLAVAFFAVSAVWMSVPSRSAEVIRVTPLSAQY